MRIPVTVIGFGLVILGSAILRPLRASYLNQASKKISIDVSKEITLRCATWYYIYPFLGFAGTIVMARAAINESNSVRLIMDIAFCLLCLLGGIYLFYRQWIGRVTILGDTLTYKEGSDHCVVQANEVLGFWSTGFVFLVHLKSEDTVRIPATFEHSEITLAFLNKAALKNA
jgi:hypothetical protein